MPFEQHYRAGETRHCIVLNCIQEAFLEDVSFNDVHVSYGGGGTVEEAAREVPHTGWDWTLRPKGPQPDPLQRWLSV